MMAYTLPDLNTRTVLDVVEENFKTIGLKTYACRVVYIGEHTLSRHELIEHFKKSVNEVNGGYCEINVYGLLLVYDSYFLHIIEFTCRWDKYTWPSLSMRSFIHVKINSKMARVSENVKQKQADLCLTNKGSEDTIHRHLRFLFAREEKWIKKMEKLDEEPVDGDVGLTTIMGEEDEMKPKRKMFKRLKLVMVYDCIKSLQFNDWRALTARPPSLVGKLDLHGSLQDHLEQLKICLDKIKNLSSFVNSDKNLSFEGLSAVDPKMEALPEVALLDFLLQSPHILDLREIANMHRRVDDYQFYFEQVWPLPTHYTPRLLYKLKIDDSFVNPLPVMPWEKVKKEMDEDECRSTLSFQADESGSSDS